MDKTIFTVNIIVLDVVNTATTSPTTYNVNCQTYQDAALMMKANIYEYIAKSDFMSLAKLGSDYVKIDTESNVIYIFITEDEVLDHDKALEYSKQCGVIVVEQ